MRVGEQLRFAEHAKLCFSAPRPSSGPCGATFPEGKVWGAHRPPVRAKATAACQREGQAPPLRYDEVGERENDERMLTNADFLGTLSSKLCDDKDEYGFFRVQRAAGGCEAVAGRPEYPLGAAR